MGFEFIDAPEMAGDAPSTEMSNTDLAINLARAIGQGLTFGFADEAEGFARSVLGDESYQEARDSARAGLEQFREEMPLAAYGSEIVASIPSAVVGGAGLTAARLAGKIPQAAAMGAAYGSGTAEEISDVPVSAGLGAATGAGLQKVAPRVTQEAQELLRRGVPVTIGQMFGGGAKRLEEAATSVPFMGDVIKGAQRRAMERFGAAAFNEALEPIGKKIPKSLTGREAYEAAEAQISKAYDDVIKGIDLPAGQSFVQSVSGTVGKYAGDLPKKEADQLTKTINREITNRIKNGRLSKQDFKDAQSAIRGQAYTFSTSTDAYQKQLGDALNDVAGELFEVLAKEAPDLATQLKKVDTAYSRFVPLQKATAKADEGIFTPAKLRQEIRAGGRRTPAAMARGELPMQQLAEAGQDVLGARLPESGSAVRGMVGVGALGGAGAGVGMPLEAMALGGAAGGLYTRPAQAFLRESIPATARALRTPAAAGLLAQELPSPISPAEAGTVPVQEVYTTPSGLRYAITEQGATLLGE
mgnify:CR=1 FL=1